MNCPYCGMKVRDPDISAYCPACGKQLPERTRDERTSAMARSVSAICVVLALVFLMMGFSLLLPEVIIAYIGGLDGHTLYWPIQLYLIGAGVILLIVRHPFARRSARANVQSILEAQKRWACSYCGKNNAPGAHECESCGAPFK